MYVYVNIFVQYVNYEDKFKISSQVLLKTSH